MWTKKKIYENPKLGIAFKYPPEWVSMVNCKLTHGIDVCMFKDFTSFGVIRVSEQVQSDIITQTEALETLLLSSVQSNEIMVGDVESNKYQTPKSPSKSATILVHKIDDRIGNIIQERTLIMERKSIRDYHLDYGDSYYECDKSSSTYRDKVFVIAFEDIPENYESGQSQQQLREIFSSFRFIWNAETIKDIDIVAVSIIALLSKSPSYVMSVYRLKQ